MKSRTTPFEEKLRCYALTAEASGTQQKNGRLVFDKKHLAFTLAASAVFGGICDLQAQASGTSGNPIANGNFAFELGNKVKFSNNGSALLRVGTNNTYVLGNGGVVGSLAQSTPVVDHTTGSGLSWRTSAMNLTKFGSWKYMGITFFSGSTQYYAWSSVRLNAGVIQFGTWAYAEVSISTPGTAALPVELTSFTTVLKGNRAELKWNTATETNNYGFDIERKTVPEGANDRTGATENWEKIGFVGGLGTSSSPNSYAFTDPAPYAGLTLYRLKQVDRDGAFAYSQIAAIVNNNTPTEFKLLQNYPNPFNPATTIQYSIPADNKVPIKVFDMLGAEVATLVDGNCAAGNHQVEFDASKLSAGTYVYTIAAGAFTECKKLVLVK